MMAKYSVEPTKVEPAGVDLDVGSFGTASCLSMFLVFLFLLVLSVWIRIGNLETKLVLAVIVGLIFGILVTGLEAKAKEDEANKRNLDSAEKEAARLTSRARACLKFISDSPSRLQESLGGVQHSLGRAELEFADNAYGPFWDCIEQATKGIAQCQGRLREMESRAVEFGTVLDGRSHTFPAVKVTSGDLPDMRPQVSKLRTLVRKGQTDHEFAVIWEHRRTQKAIIQGFRNLQEAIYDIGNSLEGRLGDLEVSIRRELVLGNEEAKLRGVTLNKIRQDIKEWG